MSFVMWITSRIQAITTALLGWLKRSSSKFYNKSFQIHSHQYCYNFAIMSNMQNARRINTTQQYKFQITIFTQNDLLIMLEKIPLNFKGSRDVKSWWNVWVVFRSKFKMLQLSRTYCYRGFIKGQAPDKWTACDVHFACLHKVLLIKKFSSSRFAHLWKPVALLLKMLMKLLNELSSY